jgi:iron complex transport system substrate-binding protein
MLKRLAVLVMVLAMMVTTGATLLAQEDGFTIQADADLQDALAGLYAAFMDGAEPVFVDADADLLATVDADLIAEAAASLPDYFLPEAALIPLTDNEQAAAFVNFAVSPAGQQVLVDAGLLPDVLEITDQDGRVVEIAQPVYGVMSAHGPSVYFLYGVGAEDRIIQANYLGVRGEVKEAIMTAINPNFMDTLSSSMNTNEVNVEEVATNGPDLMFTSPRSSWIDAVEELDIPVFLYFGETPELIKEAMLLTGEIFGPNTAAQAQAWVDYYDATIAEVAAQLEESDAEPPVVLFTGTDPLRVASGDMYQSSLIELAGGVSASGDLVGYWNDVNLEQVLLWDPDVIIVPGYGGASVEAITENEEWQVLKAVQNGAVYQLPQLVAPWDTPVPDSVLTIMWMANQFHPDTVSLDCPAEVDYFYGTFYDYTVTPENIDMLCGS